MSTAASRACFCLRLCWSWNIIVVIMSSSRTALHDAFHLFVLCVNDKRFVAALIAALSVKPLKQTLERLVEGFQVCSITHPARQP